MELIGNFNKVAKRDDALLADIHASLTSRAPENKESYESRGTIGLLEIVRVYNKCQKIPLGGIDNAFISDAINIWNE